MNENRMVRWIGTGFFAMTLLALGGVSWVSAQEAPGIQSSTVGGGVLVAPTRVVFEGRDRNAELSLVNTGTETTTYRIEFLRLRMLDDGSFETVETPVEGERFSGELVRYSPRQVTLEPGVPQTVRLQLRLPADLEPAEYRSHLLFRALPPSTGTVGRSETPTRDIDIRLTALYGITIPVIVRHGDLSASVRIESARMDADGEHVIVRLERSGERSVYGDLLLSRAGDDAALSRMKGMAIYTPNAGRTVRVRIDPSEVTPGDDLTVSFTSSDGSVATATVGGS